ncbi:DUF2442 domain-containing protein [Ilumatobacter nonamiensis]|uniref:DUF2442 domain-containing protein n=1 Tax=Ilumatobacter nonamiensis TaxID=467093 RepID=UPI000344F0D9|nr:DUF2442 domain-containing protein [Ilumatobacter nonamiensis]
MSAPYEVRAVEHLGGHRLRLTFADGVTGDVDLSDRFAGPVGPMFEPLLEVDYFAQVVVDEELGTVVWPNGADLAPDVLHAQAMSLA